MKGDRDMGLFSTIKKIIKFKKELKKNMRETAENEKRYLEMNAEDLSVLSDDELFEAITARTDSKVDRYNECEGGVNSLNSSQKIFYSVNWLEMEVNNGGLCQFFVNSSRIVAPFVSAYMGIIGAVDHKKLFDDFISKHGIDLNDLSSFDIEEVAEFEEQNQRYPFDEYDDAFYDMEPLETFLTKFIRKNIKDF